jgi:hypothetical protein
LSLKSQLCYSTFYHYDKILEIINLKEERFILAHSFRDVSPWSSDPIAFSEEAQHGKEDARSKPHYSQEAKRVM